MAADEWEFSDDDGCCLGGGELSAAATGGEDGGVCDCLFEVMPGGNVKDGIRSRRLLPVMSGDGVSGYSVAAAEDLEIMCLEGFIS